MEKQSVEAIIQALNQADVRYLIVGGLAVVAHGYATEIDLFAEAPFDFDVAYASALRLEVSPGTTATFVDLDRLISLKSLAARPQDLQDIEQLKALRKGFKDV